MASEPIRALRPEELAHGVAELAREIFGAELEVWWFGSWVRGTAVPGSDVDIALQGSGPLPPADVARLRERIDDLPTLRSVDLVDLRILSPGHRDHILEVTVKL